MPSLKQIVEQSDSAAGKIFDLVIQALIVFSLITFSLETLPSLEAETREFLRLAEIVTVVIFTAEYLLRIAVADRKLKFIFSFYGLVDLLAILPFYVASGVDLRAIRIFRLLRLFRALKIVRYSRAIRRFRVAFRMVREEMVLFFAVTMMLLYFAAVGIYYFEREAQPDIFTSVFQSMWWAVATLTTVGYGDVYPVTVGGKVFTFVILMIGLGTVAVPTGLLASALARAREGEVD